MKSPLSDAPPIKLRDLPRKFLLDELEKYFEKRPPEMAVECDYELWRCSETGLEFAWPLRPAGADFYRWISTFDTYYPGQRWEYGEVRQRVAVPATTASCSKILDVGCGDGDFLKMLDGDPARKHALDVNESSIDACRKLGFTSFCGTTELASESGFIAPGKFDVVTAFHCLEHVSDPVAFVRTLLAATAPGGELYVSTPFSPMSFESVWFDVLNHPPHHMTRWNLRAYEKLAAMTGARMRYFSPPSSAVRRTINCFKVARFGSHRAHGRIPKPVLLGQMLLHAGTTAGIFAHQLRRGRRNEGITADLILVELRR